MFTSFIYQFPPTSQSLLESDKFMNCLPTTVLPSHQMTQCSVLYELYVVKFL